MKFKADESATKLRGGYYTPPEIADLLLRWVLAIGPGRLLEPSCGDGVFLAGLARRGMLPADSAVTAFEIDPAEAAKARRAATALPGSEIHTGDFLGWSVERFSGPPLFDAVVGNPPFIRYQYLEPAAQEVAARVFRTFGLPFTRHANAWVPFVIASLALLRPGGRLAMVLPAELLHVLHAQPLRTFLAARCSRVLVLDPQELWFQGTLQGAVLVLAETRNGPGTLSSSGTSGAPADGVAVVSTRDEALLRQEPDELFRSAVYTNGPTLTGKWMPALLSRRERELLDEASRRPTVHCLGNLAEVDIGIVTGANKFFLVPDAVVERHGLAPWAFPMFGRSEHVPGVVYDEEVHAANRRAGLPGNFLRFSAEVGPDLPGSVLAYLASGEAEGLPGRYKCRIRRPWYSVPSVYATPVGMLKRCHHFPRLIRNRLGAFTTDTAYRLRPRVDPDALVASFVNSLTALCAELEGRHYGGGVLELVPSEIEKLLVPLAPAGELELRDLDRAVREGSPPGELLARRDAAVLAPAGFTAAESEELRHAWARLRTRRQRTDS